jgi:hypothetical protein
VLDGDTIDDERRRECPRPDDETSLRPH